MKLSHPLTPPLSPNPDDIQFSFSFSFFLFFFWNRVSLLPRLECSGMITAHCNFCLRGSSALPPHIFQVAGITSTHHHAQLIFVFSVETWCHHVDQAALELLTSSDMPASDSQSTGITGVSHQAQLFEFLMYPLSDGSFANIFSNSASCLFALLIVSFAMQKLFSLL